MIGCGAAAGLAAIFHAPIAGVIFVLEVIMVDFSLDAFIPVIVASITASVVTRAAWGAGALLPGSPEIFHTLSQVPLFVILGILCAVLSVAFVKFYKAVHDFWEKLSIPRFVKPALGGLFVGVAAYKFPQVLGDGYATINTVLDGGLPIVMACMLIGMKLMTTSMTLGSGGSGGMFAPTLFLGAMMGSAFGGWIRLHVPHLSSSPGAFALIGMGATMAGTLFAPVTAVIMIFEITNNYSFILPLMIASITSVVLARRLAHDSIYTIGFSRKGIRLWKGRDENILRSIRVGDVMRRDFPTVEAEWPLLKIFDQIRESPYSTIPVLNGNGKFVGILSFQTLRLLINENSLSRLLIAKDLFENDYPRLTANEDLREALAQFADCSIDELPVFSEGPDSKLLGILSRGELLVAYNNQLLRKSAAAELFRPEPIHFPGQLRKVSGYLRNRISLAISSAFKNGESKEDAA
jgi:CIC family chloride channel protein